ncbi:MAG: SDR family oxidoreductase [Proteobacteria bacterium]|nr:SDR family oxidoreductase [Pseudomonadota bacterium]
MLDRSATSLDGKVAIVTGGGGGIGRAISETFAAHGAKVVVAERHAERAAETVAAIEGRGHAAVASVVDVQRRDEVESMVATALDAYGRIDILVNNVGDFLGITHRFIKTDEDDWEALYNINLKHVFHCTKAAVPQMIEQGDGGSIINVSTIEAFRGIPGNVAYSAFNTAITGFTRSLALELGPEKIRVNAIAPETTDTLQVPVSQWIPPENRDRIPYLTPLGRYGTVDDAAGCALFLASELSAWVTGTTVHMDGGALAAGGFYRLPSGAWTNNPLVDAGAIGAPDAGPDGGIGD